MTPDNYYWPQSYNRAWITEDFLPDLVSVIVPTYNREDYITETLDSVRLQTYRPIELLIIDDGSTDSTKDVISAWSKTHSEADFKIRYECQNNQGAPVARNLGTVESRGEYIQYLDSDDLLDKNKIAAQVETLKGNLELDFVLAEVYSFQEGVTPERYLDWDPGSLERYDYFDQVISGISYPNFHTMSPLFRRRTLSRFGPWNPSLLCLQEIEYSNRLFLGGAKLELTPSAKCYFRHDKSGTRERVGYYGEKSQKKLRAVSISTWICLSEIWRKPPDHYREDPLFRNILMRHSLNCSVMLAEAGLSDYFKVSKDLIKNEAKGSGFHVRIKMLFCLSSLFGIKRGAALYRLIQGAYSTALSFSRRGHLIV